MDSLEAILENGSAGRVRGQENDRQHGMYARGKRRLEADDEKKQNRNAKYLFHATVGFQLPDRRLWRRGWRGAPGRVYCPYPLTGYHIDQRELEQGDKYKDEAHGHPHVYRLNVRHLRQRIVRRCTLRRHRENGEQAERDPGGDRIDAYPKRDPRQDDDENARYINLDEKKADGPLQDELDLKTREGT